MFNRGVANLRAWLFLCLFLAVVGCGSGGDAAGGTGGNPSAKAEKPKAIKITMIAKSSTNPFFLSCKAGAEDGAKKMSAKYGIPVTIDWQTPPTEDGQAQAQNIQTAVNSGSNAILIACSDAGKVKGAIDDAVARNVPVMTFDSDCPDSKRFVFCGSDNHQMGLQVGNELALLCKGKGNVAILAGNQNAPNLKIRADGAKEAIAKNPGMKFVGVFYHAETGQDATAAVLQAMNSNPEIDAWAFIGGWPLFSPALLTQIDPSKVRIVSADALPEELAYVKKGVVPVLVAQQPFEYGSMSVQVICEKLIDKKDPAGSTVGPDLVKVSKVNLNEWAKKLQSWGFTNVDPDLLK